MMDSLPFVFPAPEDSLLYAGEYNPVLVILSIAIAVIASYAALLVSRQVAVAKTRANRYSWLVIGALCFGVGIWSMHFVGMLAFQLPCTTSYDPLLTILSTIPGILASMLAIKLMSLDSKTTRLRLALGGVLIGGGIGAMHYSGMAALRLNGLIRYDLSLFLVSILVAVLLAVAALWIQFGRNVCSTQRCTWISALVLGLAVSGMHYTAMSAAYFVRGEASSVTSQGVSPTFLSAIVLSLTSLVVLLTIVSTLLKKLDCKTYGRFFARVSLAIAGWLAIAWFSSSHYSERVSTKSYERETRVATQQADIIASGVEESLDSLISLPRILAQDSDILHALNRFDTRSTAPLLSLDRKKALWSKDRELAFLGDRLDGIAKVFKADVLWVMNASGDTIASSNRGMADSFVGSNYADRDYFRQATQGDPGSQYAVGRTSKIPGLYFSFPVQQAGRFLGAVIVKRNITHFSTWLDKTEAFLLDANGVVVLASNPKILFHALPDARALQMDQAEVMLQYKLDRIELADMRPWRQERFPLAWMMHGNIHPSTLISRPIAGAAMTLYVAHPLEDLRRHADEQYWLFLLVFAAGCMLIVASSSIFLFLRKSRDTEASLRIAATAFESQEGMVITDSNNVILRVNQAFTEITGYSASEAVGATPNLVSSGRHDRDFYDAMWESINKIGYWKGEIWNRRKNGEIYPEFLTITAVSTSDGRVSNYVGTLTDITKSKQAEEEIRMLAFFDPLTALPNRRLLLDRLEQSIIASARGHRHGALLFIDLDNFKSLNDTLGHDVGDMLLIQVAERLKRCIRDGDTVARLGGDEFVVVLEELSSELTEAASQTELVGEKILAALNTPYQLDTHTYLSTPSIGATLFFGRQCATEDLMKQADIAMYQAKKSGRNTLRFFDPAMQTLVTAHVQMESDLRDAITRGNQLKLHFQPQVDSTGRILGAEALVRWHQPDKGLISPANFIPLAEETGLILPLGHWVLETACAQLAEWRISPSTAGLSIAVNISAKQFNMPSFVDEVLVLLDRYDIVPSRLKLEITEGILLHNIEEIITKMQSLKSRGVNFSIDDFGTGYSSLRYLKDLPLDQLKIDQSFVRDIADKANSRAIVKTIIAMSSSLNMEVIAEGVETIAQRDILIEMGCLLFQGYLFGKPQPIEVWRTPDSKDIA